MKLKFHWAMCNIFGWHSPEVTYLDKVNYVAHCKHCGKIISKPKIAS